MENCPDLLGKDDHSWERKQEGQREGLEGSHKTLKQLLC